MERFVRDECIPAEAEFEAFLHAGDRWRAVPPVVARLQRRARELGFWNLWVDAHLRRACLDGVSDDLAQALRAELPAEPISVRSYAQCARIMGRTELASLVCNWCVNASFSAPKAT